MVLMILVTRVGGSRSCIFWTKYSSIESVSRWSIDINARDKNGVTALMKAAGNGHFETADCLLQQRAIEVNQKDKFGLTALMRTAADDSPFAVRRSCTATAARSSHAA